MSSTKEIKEFFNQLEQQKSQRLKRRRIAYYSFLTFTVLFTFFGITASEKSANWIYTLDGSLDDNFYGFWNTPLSFIRTLAVIDSLAIISILVISVYLLFLKDTAINKLVYSLVIITGLFFILYVVVGIVVATTRII